MSSIRYELTHQDSALGVAYFTPHPITMTDLADCLAHVRTHPWDEFMRAHTRPLLAACPLADLRALWAENEPTTRGLILETLLLTPARAELRAELWPAREQLEALAQTSPQIFLRSALLRI